MSFTRQPYSDEPFTIHLRPGESHMWPKYNRGGYGPSAAEQRAARFKQKQEWLSSLRKKNK